MILPLLRSEELIETRRHTTSLFTASSPTTSLRRLHLKTSSSVKQLGLSGNVGMLVASSELKSPRLSSEHSVMASSVSSPRMRGEEISRRLDILT